MHRLGEDLLFLQRTQSLSQSVSRQKENGRFGSRRRGHSSPVQQGREDPLRHRVQPDSGAQQTGATATKSVRFWADTGAMVTTMTEQHLRAKFPKQKMLPTRKSFRAYNIELSPPPWVSCLSKHPTVEERRNALPSTSYRTIATRSLDYARWDSWE